MIDKDRLWFKKITKRHRGRSVGMIKDKDFGKTLRRKKAKKRLNKRIKEGRTYLKRN